MIVGDDLRWRIPHLPHDIISITAIDSWPWILCSDRTEAMLAYPKDKSIVPSDRFNTYLI